MTVVASAASVPPRRPAPRRRSPWRWLAVLVLLAALGLAAWWAWLRWGATEKPADRYVLATVQRGDIEDLVTATGTVQPRDYVDVGAQVSGQLRAINVQVGQIVAKGDLLAEIDATVFQANVDGRRASLRNQQATMKDREAQLALAQLQYTRQQNLIAEEATTKEAFQTAEATLRSARAQIEALKAQIDQTASQLRADEATLSYSRIYAPMSGTVVSITARQGQTLNTNQSAPVILRVADLSTVTVQTQVSEADIGKLRTGMDVYFTTLGSQGRRWHGQLRKVEPTPTVTNNVVLYNALFDVPNANQTLMTNMTAQVFFIAAAARDTLLVPVAAVSGGGLGVGAGAGAATGGRGRPREAAPSPDSGVGTRPEGGPGARTRGPRRATVQVLGGEGTLAEREVQIGVSNRVQVQVLAGLEEGEQVVAGLRQQPSAAARRDTSGLPPGMGPPGGLGQPGPRR